MKKLIALIFVLVLTLSVTACGGETPDKADSKPDSTVTSSVDGTSSDNLTDLTSDDTLTSDTESIENNTSSGNTVSNDDSSKDNSSQNNSSKNDTSSKETGNEVEIPVGDDWWSDDNNNNNSNNNNSNNDPNVGANSSNVFINNNNNWFNVNSITINPKRVYWQDGKLYAECFIVNGYDYTVYNIKVNKLTFSNDSGKLAEGSFPILNITLPTHTHYVHTFIFNTDSVINYGGDLRSLITNSNCNFSY